MVKREDPNSVCSTQSSGLNFRVPAPSECGLCRHLHIYVHNVHANKHTYIHVIFNNTEKIKTEILEMRISGCPVSWGDFTSRVAQQDRVARLEDKVEDL